MERHTLDQTAAAGGRRRRSELARRQVRATLPRHVVITGSTRGLGRGLARAFLDRGQLVTVCGRDDEAVQAAVDDLGGGGREERVAGLRCDVTDLEQVRALWRSAVERVGHVDIWINNAAITTPTASLWKLPDGSADDVIATNVLGVVHGCRVAIPGMLAQGGGRVYNLEGLGSDRRLAIAGSGPYSASKAAVSMLTRVLVKETRGTGVSVGLLNPGILATELITNDDLARNGGFLRAVADRVETVAPRLADHVLRDSRTGSRFTWLTRRRLLLRLATAPVTRRDPFAGR